MSSIGKNRNNTCFYVESERMAYRQAWDLQRKLVALRKDQYICSDVFMILEHPPVFTLGRRGRRNHLKVAEAKLKSAKIPLVWVERGGDITYHGPGQIIAYPIIDLQRAGLRVVAYVKQLEEVMIRLAAQWGILAGRNNLNRGVWVGRRKLGSVGIAVRRGISFHGFALNINTDLEPFGWINPCGLEGIGVTSMARELSRHIPMTGVRAALRRHIQAVFKVKLIETDLEALLAPQRLAESFILKSPEPAGLSPEVI